MIQTSNSLKAAVLIFLLPMAALVASDAPALGLGERRAIKSFQENTFPAQQEAITQAAGKPVELQVDWDKIAIPGEAQRYSTDGYWVNIFFIPTIEALKSITQDDMGKEALAAKLNKIVFTFNEDTAPASNYPNGLTFEDGTLTVNFRPGSNEGDIKPRTDAIKTLLESKL